MPPGRVGWLTRPFFSVVLLGWAGVRGAAAQRPAAQVSVADYAGAEQYLPWNIRSLVSHDEVEPHWLDNDRFWYCDHLGDGAEFIAVDPRAGTRRPLFDHARLAAALSLGDNVHPNATLLVIDELIKSNKDFDLLVFPNRNHGYASEPYLIRRTWDYFVRHLLGVEPPSYDIRPPPAEPS